MRIEFKELKEYKNGKILFYKHSFGLIIHSLLLPILLIKVTSLSPSRVLVHFTHFVTGAISLWKRFGVVKIARVPIGQLLLAALSYLFQRKLLYTVLAARGLVIFNTVLEEIKEAIRRRRETWRESMREYDEGGVSDGEY